MAVTNPKQKDLFQSMVFIYLCIWAGFLVYLLSTDTETAFIISTLKSWELVYVPGVIIPYLREAEWEGLLYLFALKSIHYVIMSYAIYMIVRYVGRALLPSSKQTETVGDADDYSAPHQKTTMQIVRPLRRGQSEAVIIDCTYKPEFYNLGRSEVSLTREPRTPVEKLQRSLLEVLEYHKEWPACIDGHHSDESLQNHSLNVARSLVKRSIIRGEVDSVALVVGLAHDLDKIAAYSKKGDRWSRKATNFRHIGKDLLRNLEGFLELDSADRRAISYAIKYSHMPESLPKDATDRELALVQDLRYADNLTTREEQESIAVNVNSGDEDGEVSLVADALWKTIEHLDVNCHKGGAAHEGWYTKGEAFWAVTNTTLLDNLESRLPQELCKKYQIAINSKKATHPAVPLITKALISMDLALTRVGVIESEDCLYNTKAGKFKFRNVRLLSAERINRYDAGMLKRWGDTDHPVRPLENKPS